MADPQIVIEAAAVFLAARPRSVAETRTRLIALGYPTGPVDEAVDRLLSAGYLDDAMFARAWVESRDRARPRGEHALRLELGRKGIDRETIEAALAERRDTTGHASEAGASARPDALAPTADLVAAQRLLDRRRPALLREPDPRKRRAKAYALLARNGFDPDICQRAAATAASEMDDQAEPA